MPENNFDHIALPFVKSGPFRLISEDLELCTPLAIKLSGSFNFVPITGTLHYPPGSKMHAFLHGFGVVDEDGVSFVYANDNPERYFELIKKYHG